VVENGFTLKKGSVSFAHTRISRRKTPCNILKVTFSLIFKLKFYKMGKVCCGHYSCAALLLVAVSLTRSFSQRLYQMFVSFNLTNMSSMTCLTRLIGAEIRYFCASPAFRKLFN